MERARFYDLPPEKRLVVHFGRALLVFGGVIVESRSPVYDFVALRLTFVEVGLEMFGERLDEFLEEIFVRYCRFGRLREVERHELHAAFRKILGCDTGMSFAKFHPRMIGRWGLQRGRHLLIQKVHFKLGDSHYIIYLCCLIYLILLF